MKVLFLALLLFIPSGIIGQDTYVRFKGEREIIPATGFKDRYKYTYEKCGEYFLYHYDGHLNFLLFEVPKKEGDAPETLLINPAMQGTSAIKLDDERKIPTAEYITSANDEQSFNVLLRMSKKYYEAHRCLKFIKIME